MKDKPNSSSFSVSKLILNDSYEIDEILRWAFFIDEKTEDKFTIYTYELSGMRYELICEKRPFGYMTANNKIITGMRNGEAIVQTNLIINLRKTKV